MFVKNRKDEGGVRSILDFYGGYMTKLILAAATAALVASAVPALAQQAACPGNPNALGVSRVVEIDTTGGPAFGLEQYKAYDFLTPKEIVLTFDDGPWPVNTRAVVEALGSHCTKAIFFPIGQHSLWHPEILKEVQAGGHTIGSHTWSHANLGNKKITLEKGKEEIEKGFSAVKLALATAAPAPFFRFPALQDPPELVKYLGERNIAIFSMDLDSFDFKMRKPEQVVKAVIDKLEKKGKGIVLLHDFQQATGKGIGQLLTELKAKGYKVVQMKAKAPVTTLPEFDTLAKAEIKGPVSDRPLTSVVRTISAAPPGK